VASHGRIPGLVNPGQTARRQGAVPRPPAPGIPACVRSGCWRVRHCPEKACAVITLPPRFLLRHSLRPATRPPAVSALPASVLTDRAMTRPAANRPQPKPEPVMALPFPVMSLPSHPASRAPRSQTRPAAQPVYLCIAAVCGNARSCRRQGLPNCRGAGIPVCRACCTGPVALGGEAGYGSRRMGERNPGRDVGRVHEDPGRFVAGGRTPTLDPRRGSGLGTSRWSSPVRSQSPGVGGCDCPARPHS
jgi:hypothetical protein